MEGQIKEILKLSDINSYDKYCQYVTNQEVIGKGANGTVMKAYVNQIQVIAVKRIELDFKSYQQQREVLKKENDFLMKIDHPNIIKTYFHFFYETPQKFRFYYIGMEHLTEDLESYLEKRKSNELSEDEVAELGYQMQKGLAYLEKNKSSHRDLKPANVLVNNDGVLKLCDFSEIKYDLFTMKSFTTNLAGSPSYLAPELKKAYLKQNFKVNYSLVKADVFSFGLILLRCLLNCQEVSIAQLNENEETTNQLIENNFSSEFQQFLKECLKFDSEKRLTFLKMNEIFELNPIKAYYSKKSIQNQIEKLEKEYNCLKQENSEIKKFNEELRKENDELKKQLNFKNQELSPFKIISKKIQIVKTDEQLQQIFNKNKQPWIKWSQYEMKKKVLENSKLKWNASSSYDDASYDDDALFTDNQLRKYKSNYYTDDKGKTWSFIDEDIPKAVNLVQQLANQTGYTNEQCLKILHSNLWNYEKSLQDMSTN